MIDLVVVMSLKGTGMMCVCVCVLGWVTVGVVVTCHEIVPDISVMSSLLISEGLGCKVCAVF